MNTHYTCVRCNSVNPFAHYERAKWHKATGIRCRRCGAVHAVVQGEVSVISRPMLPLGSEGVLSAWMLPWTRPVAIGYYECKFYQLGHTLMLYWNGYYFAEHSQGARVQMRTFKTWRGVWA